MSTNNDTLIEPDFVEPTRPNDPVFTSSINNNAVVSDRGTLDETIFQTFKRDVIDINSRLKQVVYPHFMFKYQSLSETENQPTDDASVHCDLWAPLTFIIIYAVCVSRSNARSLFSGLFVCLWFVLLVMALHLRLTKPHDNVSLISYISISGYCLFPLVINAIISELILPFIFKIGHDSPWSIRILIISKILLLCLFLAWSITAIVIVTRSKNTIETYPLALCFFGVAWLTVIL